ncbi:DNA endonuclease I-HmuI [Pseudomonas phage ZC03]|uniref:DNA endonuclease I-HmuI n=2 Tax=Zicotriavirus TaxID=2843161 RepID=A0A1L2C959_9CAUD|nr:HNH endonuclease [Pseudomonas phage ZC03]YP_009830619.1 HNH endonuclease [Pseudomonas phage ZC08]AMD43439.1 DNA endonuclease I-HmuI [Pseudomonas phage ZC03]AMD43508.1 DNA endonuclease I-HmuI [Pseudomonas phage ZC08]
MLNTIWKPVPGFEDQYEVSNTGQVRSKLRYVPTSRGKGLRPVKEKIIAQTLDSAKQYLQVSLWKNNTAKTVNVHRLVASAFHENKDNLREVNHIDGNKLNNNACNLEWCTSSENKIHARKLGLYPNLGLSGSQTSKAIGRKFSKTSKFHNVGRDNRRNKWIGSIKHNGKTYKPKRFDCEIEAAKYVDMLLDEVNDTVRPRNSELLNA